MLASVTRRNFVFARRMARCAVGIRQRAPRRTVGIRRRTPRGPL
ncbi:hypothetical protein SacazDRAFT_00006, partial [Saccharomonospora azurea NA-128]